MSSVKQALGQPTEVDCTEATDIYCYISPFPLSLVHPEEWQLEFDRDRLIRRESCTTRPTW